MTALRTTVLVLLIVIGVGRDTAAQGGYVRALWDMNPASEQVEHYYVQLDNGEPQYVYTTGPQCQAAQNTCYADFPVFDALQHTISVWASNQWGYGPGSKVSFSLGTPTAPANLRVTVPPETARGFRSVTPTAPAPLSPPTGLRQVPRTTDPQPPLPPRPATAPPTGPPSAPGVR